MNNLEKFTRWFVIPVSKLKEIPNGDGAFAAMSIGCGLCERYCRILAESQDDWTDKTFIGKAADEMKVPKDVFTDFWDVFRNGIQHQMSPKWRKGNGQNWKPYKWSISSAFAVVPEIRKNRFGEDVICIDPWKFTEFWISKFLTEPAKLDQAVHHGFGDISEG